MRRAFAIAGSGLDTDFHAFVELAAPSGLDVAELRAQTPVRLLGEHPQRAGIDAPPPLCEEAQRLVGLARVGRAEVRDHRLGLDAQRAVDRPARRGVAANGRRGADGRRGILPRPGP